MPHGEPAAELGLVRRSTMTTPQFSLVVGFLGLLTVAFLLYQFVFHRSYFNRVITPPSALWAVACFAAVLAALVEPTVTILALDVPKWLGKAGESVLLAYLLLRIVNSRRERKP